MKNTLVSIFVGTALALFTHGLGFGLWKKPSIHPAPGTNLAISTPSITPTPQERAQAAPDTLRDLAGHNLNEAEKLLLSARPSERTFLEVQFLEDWLETEPNDALQWLFTNGSARAKCQMFNKLLDRSLKSDPRRALNWVLKNDQAFLKFSTYIGDVSLGTNDDFEIGLKPLLERIGKSGHHATLQKFAAKMMADVDPARALEMANQFAGRGDRREIETHILKRTASRSPVAASEIVASTDLPIQTRKEIVISAAHSLLTEGTEPALSWGLTLQNPILRSQVIKETLWAWSEEDPIAAIDAADNLVISGDRDAAFSSVADQLFAKPETITPELAVSLQERFAQLPEDTRTQLVKQRWELGRIIDGNLW